VNALSVKVGERVVFTNDDAFAHNVFSSSAGFIFNLKVQAPGAAMPISFDKPGTVDVRCAFHPTMKLSVTVK
jgi:plastocyanin